LRTIEKVQQPKKHEQRKLDGKGDQVGDDDGNRRHQAGEVDLAEEVGIGDKGLRGAGEAVGEVVPEDGA